jgi:hypothetical protein
MMAVFKHGLDKVLNKFISRKLLVWLVATVLMYTAKIESSDWILISMVYLGSQGVLDIVERIYKARTTTTTITENKNV